MLPVATEQKREGEEERYIYIYSEYFIFCKFSLFYIFIYAGWITAVANLFELYLLGEDRESHDRASYLEEKKNQEREEKEARTEK